VWTGLDHVLVAVRDLERATATAARLLGRRPSWRGEHPGAGSANALFRVENTLLELLAPRGTGAVGDALRERLATAGEGLAGLAFGTTDADACHAALARAGLEPEPPRDGLGRDVESGAFRRWRTVMLPPARTRGVLLFAIERRSPPELLPASAPIDAPEACVHALDHVVVRTGDAEAARRLYGDALGLRLALDRSFEAWGVRLLFFRVGGVTVELAARLPGQAAAGLGDEPAAGEDRLFGLSWRVGDADAARARVAAAGLEVSAVRDGRRPGTRVFTVRGEPLGVATLMLEPPERGAGAAAREDG
jgi:catechol 2,3-dioxygenase-like lactoylglutathione lyase family enzyme